MDTDRLRAWIVVLGKAVWYFLYRLGLRRKPTLMDARREIMLVMDHYFGWGKKLRVVDSHLCPRSDPVIFVGNHITGLDPFIMFRAINLSSELYPRFMMREGVFREGSWAKWKMLDLDEISIMSGTFLISRESVHLSQLKPFIQLLREADSFIMYPGRTRSRSGLFVEYKEGIEEPGAVSFFVMQGQRGRPEKPVAVAPIVRTLNPVTWGSALVFGEPQYLPHDADRARQREFDLALMKVLGDLIEINVPHIVSTLLCLRCLHGLSDGLDVARLTKDVSNILGRLPGRHVDPAALSGTESEVAQTLKWMAKQGVIELTGATVRARSDVILAAPSPDREYRKKNPVKFIANQIIHLPDVVAAVEDTVLGN